MSRIEAYCLKNKSCPNFAADNSLPRLSYFLEVSEVSEGTGNNVVTSLPPSLSLAMDLIVKDMQLLIFCLVNSRKRGD